MASVDGTERRARTPHYPKRGAVTQPRVAAALIMAALRDGDLLNAAFERHAGDLEVRDRRWIQELVWGTLRRRSWIDAVLEQRVKGGVRVLDAEIVDLLRLGAYQLLFMGSVPVYAAIAQTVELAKQRTGIGASKLVNAVLRRIDRERGSDTDNSQLAPPTPVSATNALAQTHSHPEWVVARWVERFGCDATEALLVANNGVAPIAVRPFGVDRDTLLDMLQGEGVETTPVPLVSDSLQLGAGVALTELRAFQEGALFVQDPAATLVTQYADIAHGAVVADLCAAPGGKALELSRRAQHVFACDRSMPRAERMLLGFGRLNVPNVQVLVADATAPTVTPVDVVLLDVPCTGTGTFRRHPDARWRLRMSDFAVLGATQRAILRAAAALVKPGGLLIYSTCSLELEENDDVIAAFLADNRDFVLEPPTVGAVADSVLDSGMLRVLPQVHGTDGAFAARMRRAA